MFFFVKSYFLLKDLHILAGNVKRLILLYRLIWHSNNSLDLSTLFGDLVERHYD